MKPRVQHWEISSNDYKKSQEFYRKVFDWDINEHEGMSYALIAPGGDDSIGGGIGPVQDGQKPMVTVYITVDDIPGYLKKVEEAGGKIILNETPIPDIGTCGMFIDPDGNVLGLYKSLKA